MQLLKTGNVCLQNMFKITIKKVLRCTIPEGVEVKLSADLIRPLVIGKIIKSAYSTSNSRYGDSQDGNRKLGEDYNRFIDFDSNNPTKVESIGVKGKFMYWTFTDGWTMFCTFGMTGQWSPLKGKHPCFVFEFEDGTAVYFNDPRHFGTIRFIWDIQALSDKINELGWDPLGMPLDKNLNWIIHTLSRNKKCIAEVLMDQSIFSGVGNYIRAEALYLSKISPWRQTNLLTKDEVNSLCQCIVKVMEESYQHQGATISTYKTVYGEEGKYSTLFKVYGQKTDPAGHKIIRQQTPDKRTIHWCPNVQS